MTDDELLAWRAAIKPGSRVGSAFGSQVHMATVDWEGLSFPGTRRWRITWDQPHFLTGDTLSETYPESYLIPPPHPDARGIVLLPPPPRRRRARRARRATA